MACFVDEPKVTTEDLHLELEEILGAEFDDNLSENVFSLYSDAPASSEPAPLISHSPMPAPKFRLVDRATFEKQQPKPTACPCCKTHVGGDDAAFHAHVQDCFLVKQKQKARAPKKPVSEIQNSLLSIRSAINGMNLRRRIDLLESMNRLATLSATRSLEEQPNLKKLDFETLSLLFSANGTYSPSNGVLARAPSPTVDQPTEGLLGLVPPPISIPEHNVSWEPFLSEHATPPLFAIAKGSKHPFEESNNATMLPPSCDFPVRSSTKRKLECAQELSYTKLRVR